jgi:hypothetical protein
MSDCCRGTARCLQPDPPIIGISNDTPDVSLSNHRSVSYPGTSSIPDRIDAIKEATVRSVREIELLRPPTENRDVSLWMDKAATVRNMDGKRGYSL